MRPSDRERERERALGKEKDRKVKKIVCLLNETEDKENVKICRHLNSE